MPDTEKTTLEVAQERWRTVRDSEIEKAIRDIDDLKYFTGEDQGWDQDGARAKLEAEGRPALTLNRIAPIIRLIAGARPQTKTGYFPVEEGDLTTANVFNACSDHVDRQNMWEFLSNDLFLNMLIKKGAVIELEPDYDNDPSGEISLRLDDRFEWWFDPISKNKARWDGEYAFRALQLTPEAAKRMFPKKKAEIENIVSHVEGQSPAVKHNTATGADQYEVDLGQYYDAGTKLLTILYYWYKEFETVTKIIDIATGDVLDAAKDKETTEKELTKMPNGDRFRVVEQQITNVKWLTFSGDTELESGDTPWNRPDRKKTVLSQQIPVISFELDRIFAGAHQELVSLIDPLKDPQKFYNKLSSAVLQIIGTTANSGWMYETNALDDEEKKKIKDYGSKPGINIETKDGAMAEGRIQKISPSAPPVGQIEYANVLASALLDISGVESLVSTKALGKGASGKAIDLKQKQGGNVISWVYDTFDFYLFILAMFKRDAIQTMFDYEKIIRIKGPNKAEYVTINEAVYDEAGGISQILNDVTTGKYDTSIQRKDALPTIRLERFRYFAELVKSGALPLPPEVMVKIVMSLMDDPELKDEVEREMGNFMAMRQGPPGGGMPMPGGPAQIPPEVMAAMMQGQGAGV